MTYAQALEQILAEARRKLREAALEYGRGTGEPGEDDALYLAAVEYAEALRQR